MSRTRGEILRFAFAGIAGLVADVGVLYLALGLGPYAARLLSFPCAVFVTWQINRHYTFAAAGRGASLWREWWAYLGAMLGGGAVNYAVYTILVQFGPAHSLLPMLAVAAGGLAGMAVNFASAKLFVFRR